VTHQRQNASFENTMTLNNHISSHTHLKEAPLMMVLVH